LVIKSSSTNGFCYLQTSNLDGESALKPREAHTVFQGLGIEDIKGTIELDQPSPNIYNVTGTIDLEGKDRQHLTIDNVLLRGGTLKNVDFIYGMVLYTGKDTKIMQNIKHSSLKNSSIENTLNKVVIPVIVIVISFSVGCTIFGMIYMVRRVFNYRGYRFLCMIRT
jgi:magnesium-transporting ATPase (P-type)